MTVHGTHRAFRAALIATLVAVALPVTAVAAGGDRGWTQRDFRLREITAYIGAPESSYAEFSGTMTPQAYNAGLIPWFTSGLRLTARVTCSSPATPTVSTPATAISDGKDGLGLISWTHGYAHVDAGTIKWSLRMTFKRPPGDESMATYFCQSAAGSGDPILRDYTLTSLRGMTWASSFGVSPTPGTTLYAYDLGTGFTKLRYQNKDGDHIPATE